MSNVDPYALDVKAGQSQQRAILGGGNLGIPCPNKMAGKPCAACDAAIKAFDAGNEVFGKKIYHKKLPFINAEFANEKGVVYTMALPVDCAKAIMDNVYGNQSWGNIAHPTKGLPMVLTKTKKGDFSNYAISPKVAADETEKRLSGAAVIKNAPTQEVILSSFSNDTEGKLKLFIPKRDMKDGDTVVFKIIPNPSNPTQPFVYWAYVHYGVTQAQINGEVPIVANAAATGTQAASKQQNTPPAAQGTGSTDDFGDLGGGGDPFSTTGSDSFDEIPFN